MLLDDLGLNVQHNQRNGSYNHLCEPRSLPMSEDAEKGVLCSLLLNPREVSDMCRSILTAEAFYIPAHRTVYETIFALIASNRPVEFVTVCQALRDRCLLEEVGGKEAVCAFFNFIPTAANADYYVSIMREKYLLRRM